MNQSPIPVLGIPHYNRSDLLARCIASIDYPVELLVIVQQGPEMVYFGGGRRITRIDRKKFNDGGIESIEETPVHLCDVPACVKNIVSIIHPNAGVAGAWNEIIKLHPAAWWLIANNDIQFAPGDLEKMAYGANGRIAEQPVGMLYGNHGASFFVLTAYGIGMAGLFDENIFPAYLEDCDMACRMDRLGVTRVNVQGLGAIHGDKKLTGSCTVNDSQELQQKNARTHGGNFEYYIAKWGGRNGEEKFSTPFNDPHWPIDFWRFDPVRRAKQMW